VGKNLNAGQADHEFIGMAYFSKQGASLLQEVYDDCVGKKQAPFHEAESIERGGVTDMIQELIDRNIPVYGREIQKGWIEGHNKEDVKAAEKEIAAVEQIA
jgi:hypothetical protein